jgi:hypothetical protein
MARAFEVPLYQLFYEGEEPPNVPTLLRQKSPKDAWGSIGKDAQFLSKLRRALGKANEDDRKLVLNMARKMARR